MSYQHRKEYKLHVPVRLEIDKIVLWAVRGGQDTHFSLHAAIARLGQRNSSRATMDLNREIKEPCGSRLVCLLHRTCPWESNSLPSHQLTVRLQLHLEDNSLLSSDDDLAVLLIALWVLEVTFQANTNVRLVERKPSKRGRLLVI